MNNPVIVIGMGEIGSVIARGFLRSGQAVVPVIRSTDINQLATDIPDPQLVIVAVGENDLHSSIDSVPEKWRDKITLIQNELLPGDWQKHDLKSPTVMSVWFEKKQGMDSKVVVPSVVYGPGAEKLQQALAALNLPVEILNDEDELLFELVRKNLYILTSNISGIRTGGSVSDLWENHRDFAESVAADVLKIQSHLTGQSLDQSRLIDAMVKAFNGDPDHQCMGRSAPARLERALTIAKNADIELTTLDKISSEA